MINNIDLEENLKYIRDMANFFKILADNTRIKIILTIGDGEQNVNSISEKISMSKSAVSHQLALLRAARLVKYRKEGKEVYYSLDDDHIKLLVNAAWEHVNE